MRRWATATLVAGLFVAATAPAAAYSPRSTHRGLTDLAVDYYNAVYGTELTDEQREWLVEGSELEDTPPRWVNHFYDPTTGEGWTGEEAGDAPKEATQVFSRLGISTQKPLPSTKWVRDENAQLRSRRYGGNQAWDYALDQYAEGNEKEAWVALGHLLHLVQDASVPAHTRNDTHAHIPGVDPGSPYETYTKQWGRENIREWGVVEKLLADETQPPSLPEPEDYIVDTAEYSNTHFFSRDTISNEKYQNPLLDLLERRCEGKFCLGYNTDNRGKFPVVGIVENFRDGELKTEYRLFKEEKYHPILNAYFSRLAAEATVNSAGAINLFQKKAADARINQGYQFQETDNELISKLLDIPNFSLVGEARRFTNWIGDAARATGDTIGGAVDAVRGLFAGDDEGPEELAVIDTSEQRDSSATLQNDSDENNETLPPQGRQNDGGENQRDPSVAPLPQDDPTAQSARAGDGEVGVERVVDGDTILLSNGRYVRYIGVNAPELGDSQTPHQCYAEEATEANRELILGKEIRLEQGPEDTDDYNRLLRYVYVGDTLVNEALISDGAVYSFDFGHTHPKGTQFEAVEQDAREENRGLWGACGEQAATEEELEAVAEANNFDHASAPKLIVNELQADGDEFIEVYNPNDEPVALENYAFAYYSKTRTDWGDPWRYKQFPERTVIAPQSFFAIGFGDYTEANIDWYPYQSNQLSNAAGTVALWAGDLEEGAATRVDALGWGGVTLAEGSPAAVFDEEGAFMRRLTGYDTDDNDNDFSYTTMPTPGEENKSRRPLAVISGNSSVGEGSSSVEDDGDDEGQDTSDDSQNDESDGEEGAGDSSQTQNDVKLVINEVMYDLDGADSGREWVEIYNSDTVEADLSAGWRFREDDTNHLLEVVQGQAELPTGGYAVIADDSDAFLADHPDYAGILINSSFSLKNTGEELAIVNTNGEADFVANTHTYDPALGADGDGNSLQRFSTGWQAALPTPGAANEGIGGGDTSEADLVPPEADHVVISEVFFDAEGGDVGNEFVELYNPTVDPVALDDWALTIGESSSTSTETLASFGSKDEDKLTIAGDSFLLVGLNGYTSTSTEANIIRSKSLPNSGEHHISLLDKTDNENITVDQVSYSADSLNAGQSYERRAWSADTGCASPQNDGEYLGNGCENPTLVPRPEPTPQNTSSLPEPRKALKQTEFIATYNPETWSVELSWASSTDVFGSPAQYELTHTFSTEPPIGGAGSANLLSVATSTEHRFSVAELGANHEFTLTTFDVDGLGSATTTSVSTPSPFEAYFYTNGSGDPVLDLRYNPISTTWGDAPIYPYYHEGYSSGKGIRYQGLVLWHNINPQKHNGILDTNDNWQPEHAGNVLGVKQRGKSHRSYILGMTSAAVDGSGPAIEKRATLLPEEDNRFLIPLDLEENPQAGDYVTISYYSLNPDGGGNVYLERVASDVTHITYQEELPPMAPPEIPGEITLDFTPLTGTLTATWQAATDADSPDGGITYEASIVPTGEPHDWQATKKPNDRRFSRALAFSTSTYTIAIRGIDNEGNAGEPLTAEWSFPDGYSPFTKSSPTKTASQEFVLAEDGTLGAITIHPVDFQQNGTRMKYLRCSMVLRDGTGDIFAESNEHKSWGCASGAQTYQFAEQPELLAGETYTWEYRMWSISSVSADHSFSTRFYRTGEEFALTLADTTSTTMLSNVE